MAFFLLGLQSGGTATGQHLAKQVYESGRDRLEGLSKQLLELLVLDFGVRLDCALGGGAGLVELRRVRQLDHTVLGDCESDEDLSGEIGGLLEGERLVGFKETVLSALGDTKTSLRLVLERAQGEGEGASFVGDLGEGVTRCLHLKRVLDFGRFAVDCCEDRSGLGLLLVPQEWSANGSEATWNRGELTAAFAELVTETSRWYTMPSSRVCVTLLSLRCSRLGKGQMVLEAWMSLRACCAKVSLGSASFYAMPSFPSRAHLVGEKT